MNKQLKIAVTATLAALGIAAAVPAQAFPSSALEFSQITPTAIATANAAAPQITAAVPGPFPSAALEFSQITSATTSIATAGAAAPKAVMAATTGTTPYPNAGMEF